MENPSLIAKLWPIILILTLPYLYLHSINVVAHRRANYAWASRGYTVQAGAGKWELFKGDYTGWPYKRIDYLVTRPGESFPISVTVDIFFSTEVWNER